MNWIHTAFGGCSIYLLRKFLINFELFVFERYILKQLGEWVGMRARARVSVGGCVRACVCRWVGACVRACVGFFWGGICFFVLCLVYPMLPVSLKCPFLIASSVFSNVCYR